MKKCKQCGETFKPFTTLQKYCSARCMKEDKGFKAIKKVSAKRQTENEIYSQLRKVFLAKPENKFCPVIKQLKNINVETTEVHHMRGRIGKLLLDTKHWLAVSRDGHSYIEQNPEWAKENGYSLNRL